MLFVKQNPGPGTYPIEASWHIGTPTHDIIPNKVEFIQADGDELDYIMALFVPNTLPVTKKQVQRWYGDIAKQIAWSL